MHSILASQLRQGLLLLQELLRDLSFEGRCVASRRHGRYSILFPTASLSELLGPLYQVWGIDVTYIRLRTSWMYLVAVLDWFSRFVVSWELDDTLQLPFVLSAVQRALAQARPVIWNSDQGSHFTSSQYRELLLAAEVQISMDGKGRALDNIFVERLWRSVKYEEVYPNDYANPREVRAGLARYLAFYNHERPHQALNSCTPAALYLPATSREKASGEHRDEWSGVLAPRPARGRRLRAYRASVAENA
jgi:putative transposase